jgi:hypothetical protein
LVERDGTRDRQNKDIDGSSELACDYAKLSEMNDQLNREERKHEEYLENYVRCVRKWVYNRIMSDFEPFLKKII